MNRIKPFQQFIKESNGKSIGDRFEELVDESDYLGAELKIDSKVQLNEICGKLKEEYPNVFKIECDFTSFYGSDKYDVTMRSFNTEKDFEDGDPSDYKVVKVSIPSDDDDFNPPGFGDRYY